MIIINGHKYYTRSEAADLLGILVRSLEYWIDKRPELVTPIEGKSYLSAEAVRELSERITKK